MKKKRICYIVSHLDNQGPVNVLYGTLKHLYYSEFEVFIVCYEKERKTSIINKFSELPITIVRKVPKCRFNLFRIRKILKAEIRAINPDLIHSHSFVWPLLFKMTNIPSIHTAHIFPGIQTKKMKGQILGSILNFITLYSYKRGVKIVPCSESLKNELTEAGIECMNAISNGVELPQGKVDQSILREKLGLKPNKTYFVSLGRLSPEKNYDFLGRLFEKVSGDLNLLVLGNGEELELLSQKYKKNIHFLGFKSNAADYLKAADYYISSSMTEGMPMAVLEGLSNRLPAVLSDIPQHKEIENTLKTGIKLFRQNDMNDALNAISHLLKFDSNEYRNELLRRFQDNYTSNSMSKNYMALYNELLK